MVCSLPFRLRPCVTLPSVGFSLSEFAHLDTSRRRRGTTKLDSDMLNATTVVIRAQISAQRQQRESSRETRTGLRLLCGLKAFSRGTTQVRAE